MKCVNRTAQSGELGGRRSFIKATIAAGAGLSLTAQAGAAKPSATFPSVIIYHVERRRSERIVWLLEEYEKPYELVFKPGDLAGSMAIAKTVHPLAVVPTVKIAGDVMVESGAIIEYIATKYADRQLWPSTESANYRHHLLWMHFAEGSACARIADDFLLHTVKPEGLSPIAKSQMGGAARVMNMIESHLSEYPYFGGSEFTTADIMMRFPIWLAQIWGVDLSLYPHVEPWISRVEARPAFKRMRLKALPNGEPPLGLLDQKVLSGTGKGTSSEAR